jgi:hypothetical protein
MRGLFSRRPPRGLIRPIVQAHFVPADVGLSAAEYSPGDFLLTQGQSWVSKLIRIGQMFRFGLGSPYAYWSHSALLVDSHGTLIEAMASGIEYGHLDRYRNQPYTLVRVGTTMSREDRDQAIAFARSCVGWEYGYLTFVSIALSCLTGGRLSFGREAEEVCSGLVARALERGATIFPRDPRGMTPGDLARYFGVAPPAGSL